jgi:hypothetical protein
MFLLASGNHAITIVPTLSLDGGSGYMLAQVVPEPSLPALLGSGLGALWLHRRLRFWRRSNRPKN